jgi:hypothetical protein
MKRVVVSAAEEKGEVIVAVAVFDVFRITELARRGGALEQIPLGSRDLPTTSRSVRGT